MPANLENSTLSTGLEKVSFHSNPKKGNAKECSNYHTIALISHTGKVMLKILQGKTASTVHELRTSRHSSWILKRQRNEKSNCQHTLDHRKSKGIPEKHLLLLIDSMDHNKLENSERNGNTRPPDLPPKKSVWRSRSNH